jgi:hypothetical protein
MYVDLTFTFHCSVGGCHETDTQHFEYVRTVFGTHLPHPTVPPAGWVQMGVLLFCPRHTLMLTVDGQEQVIA